MSTERKWKILALILLLTLLYTGRTTVRPIGALNRILVRYMPWKVLLAGYAIHFVCSHFLDILGLGAHDLPEQHYHRDFANVRKVLSGLDAGIVSTLHVQPKCLRDTLSILLGAYYIVAPHQAENRMHRFHQQATIEGIRACWTKARHPILWAIAKNKQRSLINIHRRRILINPIEILQLDADIHTAEYGNKPIEAYLYFQGTDNELARATQLVINYPGGGFVTMNHLHHESYIQKWCNYLHIPFIQIDYRKAPEHQYPAGFNDAYFAYACVVHTRGRILGMNAKRARIKVALSGDSAGGNFVAAVCCRAIVEGIQIPSGLLMAYPCLDLNMTLLRAVNTAIDLKRNCTNTIARYSFLPTDIDKGDVLSSVDDTPLRKYVESKEDINSILQNAQLELSRDNNNTDGNSKDHMKRSLLRNKSGTHMFTSRVRFLNDGVLPITYLLLLGEMYVPDNADPINDMYLSPVRAPLHVLAKFPCTRIHVGSVDPLVDDSRRFTTLLKFANQHNDVKLLEWEGVSHAYLQCPTFLLPQARFSCELSVQWLSQMLDVKVVNPESFKYDYDKREKGLKDATDDLAFLRSRM